jgi:uncharacterized protein YjiS (DUF1127 family)
MAIMTSTIVPQHVSIASFVADAVAKFAATRRANRTVKMLEALNDHELNDIGLTRSTIFDAVHGLR